ncbi:hypothetical protein [Flammeovirga agarivorans]|uniref:Uncharacterized protein n=1 Tax=Flammeovirga agarivorans TaxID=2726742 RepID=A0A7X8SIS7_9BACT|nr:hypothetical protein [Flammeovirga agarivorans]NLR91033.1 hypothetical protein [Flammeovirga agarivorans]
MKKISLIVLALVSVSFFAFCQGKGDPKKREEAKKEINAYMKANVLPVMIEQRKELDKKLSSSEKKEIESLRARINTLKAQKENMPKRDRSQEPTEEQRKAFEAAKKEMRLIMTDAWAIVDNHEADFEALKEGNKENAEKWKADMKAIFDKYKPEGAEGKRGGKGGRHGKMGMMMDQNKAPMFLLMDPTKSVDELAAEMEQRQAGRQGHHRGGKRK